VKALHGAEAQDLSEPYVLRILLVENDLSDAELIGARLSQGGTHIELVRVGSREAFGKALREGGIHVIVADYALASSDSWSALKLAREVHPGVPFIVTSGTLDEKVAIEALQGGADDCVPKQRLERLLPAVRRALREGGERRGRAEEARTGSEEYRAMFESASVGMVRADRWNERLLLVNPKLCKITGYSEHELLGITLAELTHPEERAGHVARYFALVNGETSEYTVEERYIRKDGEIIWVSVDAALTRDESGRATGVVATLRDVTERKRDEEQLSRLASFSRLSPIPIIETAIAGGPTFINPAAQERFPDLAALGPHHPILTNLESIDREIEDSSKRFVESEVWVDGILYERLVLAGPGSGLLRIYAADITERRRAEKALRKSEERFRWTFEQAAENIFVVDPESRCILDANAALQRLLGYTLDELKGMTLYDLVAHDRESVDHNIERVVAEGNFFVGERKYSRKDSSSVDVEVNAGAIPYGESQALCVVSHNITERKRTETVLRQNLSVLLALREAGQVLSSTLESDEVVTRLLEIMRSVAGLTAAVVSRRDREDNLRVWRSAGLESLWPRVRFTPEAEGARREALENEGQTPFWLKRPGFEDQYLAGLCLPLRVRNRTIGVLEAYGKESLAQDDTIEIISSLTSQAAGALENARLYETLGHREHALQDLVKKLLGTQEEERRRVAYEVHDGLAQVAVAAHQNLQAFARRHPPQSEKGRKELDRILGQVRATVSDARRVIANLRPTALDDLGLAAAISLEVERLTEEGYHVSYEEHLGKGRLPAEMEITLFRVLQEALTNIRKHAQTRRVSIELLRGDGEVCLEVRDFGRGFDPAELEKPGSGPGERVGFAGMRERVSTLDGELEIESHQDVGTSIVAIIPVKWDT
jgi:PAS domain S-box-containing protein